MIVGKTFSDLEIAGAQEAKKLFVTLRSAAEFELDWSGERTFKDIAEFQDLFINGSTVLDFRHCLLGVDNAFAKEPLTRDQLHTPRRVAGAEQNRQTLYPKRLLKNLSRETYPGGSSVAVASKRSSTHSRSRRTSGRHLWKLAEDHMRQHRGWCVGKDSGGHNTEDMWH
jgi:hypothetical protein